MKPIILIIICGVFMLLMSADIQGFRSLKWGDGIEKLGDDRSEFSRDEKYKHYTFMKRNENKSLGGISLIYITYDFFDNKLYAVTSSYGGQENFTKLKEVFNQKYGKSSQYTDSFFEKYTWNDRDTFVSLVYSNLNEQGMFLISSKSLSKQNDEYKIKIAKEIAKEL